MGFDWNVAFTPLVQFMGSSSTSRDLAWPALNLPSLSHRNIHSILSAHGKVSSFSTLIDSQNLRYFQTPLLYLLAVDFARAVPGTCFTFSSASLHCCTMVCWHIGEGRGWALVGNEEYIARLTWGPEGRGWALFVPYKCSTCHRWPQSYIHDEGTNSNQTIGVVQASSGKWLCLGRQL